jgi:hypothetical protein
MEKTVGHFIMSSLSMFSIAIAAPAPLRMDFRADAVTMGDCDTSCFCHKKDLSAQVLLGAGGSGSIFWPRVELGRAEASIR